MVDSGRRRANSPWTPSGKMCCRADGASFRQQNHLQNVPSVLWDGIGPDIVVLAKQTAVRTGRRSAAGIGEDQASAAAFAGVSASIANAAAMCER